MAPALVSLALAASCGARAPVTPEPVFTETPSPLDLELRIAKQRNVLKRFRGQARLKYESPQGSGRTSQMIVVEEPDRIRIDFMSPFGPTYTVAANGQTLVAYDRGEKVLYRGAPTPNNVLQYTRVAAGIPLLASLMRGLPPELERKGMASVSDTPDGWALQVDLTGGGTLTVVFDRASLDPVAVSIFGAAYGGDIDASFTDYEEIDGVSIPHQVNAKFPGGGEVELKYSRIWWRNVGLTDDAFTIEAPPGVSVVDMDRAQLLSSGG